MRTIVLCLFGFVISTSSLFAQSEKAIPQDGLKVQGNVKSIKIKQEKSTTLIRLELLIQLHNTGLSPIILWKQKDRVDGFQGGTDLINIRQIISRDQGFTKSGILDERYRGPSWSGNPAWQQVRKDLNQKVPPPSFTITLLPNQSISYNTEALIVCNQYRTDSVPQHPTFEELQNVGILWLRLYYEAWSFNLESDRQQALKNKFGRTLQKKWKRFGKLRLDDFYTEPIQIDLKQAVFER